MGAWMQGPVLANLQSIPFGLFPKTLEITVLRLPRNHLKALPDDIGALRWAGKAIQWRSCSMQAPVVGV
jgi:hypothetical protein